MEAPRAYVCKQILGLCQGLTVLESLCSQPNLLRTRFQLLKLTHFNNLDLTQTFQTIFEISKIKLKLFKHMLQFKNTNLNYSNVC